MDEKNKILLIDDEIDFTTSMAFWLESKGYPVIVANSAEDGIQMVKKENPALVFLDLKMPVIDGIEALKRIREFNKDVPIIIISAHLEKLKLTEAEHYEISGIFYKGEDFEKGLNLIKTALRTHKKLKSK
jgi:CheY-like chemotaxis protein